MIDGAEGITKGDAAIAGLAHEKGKGVISKWKRKLIYTKKF